MTTKEKIHGVVDSLSDEEAKAALEYLSRLRADPVFRGLAIAPIDDEELSAEDEAALNEAYADLEAGRVVPDEQLESKLNES